MAALREIPDWLVERLAAGELPPAQADSIRRRLEENGQEHRLATLARSNEEVLSKYPPQVVASEVRRRLAAERTSRPRLRPFWTLSMATACAAGLAMVWAVRDHRTARAPSSTEPTEEQITVKGETKPELLVYRKTAAGSEQLHGHAGVRAGDVLQIRYVAAGKKFGIIASVDSRGHITYHLPESPGPAASLARDGERALSHAYELDDSPALERFVFVTAETPFDASEILPLLRNGSPLPARFSFYELALKKEVP